MIKILGSVRWPNFEVLGLGLFLSILCVALAREALSWGAAIVSALFGMIVLVVVIFSLATVRENRHLKISSKRHPDQPWLWDIKWQSDLIPSRSRWDFGGSLFATVFVSLLALPMFAAIPKELSDGNLFVFLGLIPIGVAGYLGRYSYKSWRSSRIEKNMSLFLETRPAFIGTNLSARLVMPSSLKVQSLKATLEHLKIVKTEDSEGITFTKSVDLRLDSRIQRNRDASGYHLVGIIVDVPRNCPPTSWGPAKSDSYWDLIVEMRVENCDVSVRYEIPVADPRQHTVLH